MASPGDDSASNAQLEQPESVEPTPEPAFQEAQKWIEAVTGRSFCDKDFRSGLENGVLLCKLLSSIKPGLVKKINRLPTPIAGLDNLTLFLRGCEELGLKGSQLFDPGDLQDTSIRANLTGSDCSRKLKNVLITIYWLGKAANSCATYNGPTLNLKEFEGLLSMMRKECVSEDLDSPKRSIRDSGYIDSWESERSDSLSPPRHGRDDSFDSLDSFGTRSRNTPSPDTVLRCNSDDSEGDGSHRKLPDVRKDDMSARRVSFKEPRAALPFNQYLPNKSNQTNYLPAPLRKRRSEREEDRRSVSNSTSPVGERPLREESLEVLKEGAVMSQSHVLQKTINWEGEKGVELEEADLNKMRKLKKAGIKVLPASVRYNSPNVIAEESNKAKPPSPDIILRRDNDFLRAAAPHEWDSNEEDEDEEGERKVPDVQKDDLASRRARINQFKPSVTHYFLPGSCSWKDREKWEGIRLASQHAVLERLEKMEQEKRSLADSTSSEVSIITRKDNPFLNPEKEREKEGDEEDERELERRIVIPNPHKDDLARRRAGRGPCPPKDPHQSLVQTSITQSDLEKWQRLKMNTESSEAGSILAEVSIITRKDNPFLCPEKDSGSEEEKEKGPVREDGGRVVMPNVMKDDLARRRSQSGPTPQRDPRQSLLQTTITQSDLEKWQRLKMNTESRNEPAEQLPKTPVPVSVVAQKIPDIVHTTATNVDCCGSYDDYEECGDEGPLPDIDKDDMLTRRTEAHQKPNGGTGQPFNAFLPKLGAVKHKNTPASGFQQSYLNPKEQEKVPALDSFTLSSVAPPPRDAEDTPRKCPQLMDRQETGSVGVVGQESLIKNETITKSSSPKPDRASRRPHWQEDDDLPPIFRATSVSDETESTSLIDMRDEEELAYLRQHSQSRHERLHNQYNKHKEEEDQWQDDLARWKNRRRSASQDLIRKEKERKMMEKLMTTDGGSGHRKKSIKTYKEIVEEKERREQELHEQYSKASTPEEKAAVLQRYALRFTISDAILEKLQLPKLPSAATPIHTSPLHQHVKQSTCPAPVEPEAPEAPEPTQTTQTQHSVLADQQIVQNQTPGQPKSPEPSPTKTTKTPEIPSAPIRPLVCSKPVPLITPKPYSQPRLSQGPHKTLKTDGLVRVNGESTQEERRDRAAGVSLIHPVSFSSSPPKSATQTQQIEDLAVLETSHHQQNTQTSLPDQEKKVIMKEKECSLSIHKENSKEETSTTLQSEPAEKQSMPDMMVKRSCVVTTTIVTELTQTHPVQQNDTSIADQICGSVQNSFDLSTSIESSKADQTSYSLSMTEGTDYSIECIETPMLNLAKRVDHWTWDPNEERRRQERWQQEQERLLQEKYQREQEKLKEEWERAQKEVEEEERRYHEEEKRILEETVTPLTPHSSVLPSRSVTEAPSLSQPPHDTIVLSLADWERKQEMLERQAQTNQSNGLTHSPDEVITPAQQNGQRTEPQESQTATPQLQFIQDGSWNCKSKGRQEDLKKTASLDRKQSPPQSQTTGMRRTGSCENVLGTQSSKSPSPSQDTLPPSPSRSVSGKKLCSSCAHPLGKGAAMIIETLGLYFHIQCFKCGICKGLLGDTSAGTDVRIRNGLLNCQECYIKSRAAGQPTTL
ncbi:LIM and calponin homology domains-containing protein 1a isoform X9 [Myxocyprinus asiaticus]|uniref:LIM and calponin homology domains-containing protein 1a isoform X9 n=1 Tax=Myxocyprinus asiaticus TaxID=70543 RepID=UPI002221FC76|nr:LIM and calponin homology domains-containing protein 1a isoform X9 [Myxocyprinus asiaticus]